MDTLQHFLAKIQAKSPSLILIDGDLCRLRVPLSAKHRRILLGQALHILKIRVDAGDPVSFLDVMQVAKLTDDGFGGDA